MIQTIGNIVNLQYLDKDFILDCMSVPSYSNMEGMVSSYIENWANENGISIKKDSIGNLYLTKGEVKDGEYYPCVTSHMDTVHISHVEYIEKEKDLDLAIELMWDGKHKLFVNSEENIGIGADDKAGICICLSLFQYFDALKACFFINEEQGCFGSRELDTDWFNDVGYVVGFDSPELYRSSWKCNGVKLFDYNFYENYIRPICSKWGLEDHCFRSEPYTDVVYIRKKTGLICMNFGNGGYEPHTEYEYCVLEDMDTACGMGIDVIQTIGNERHYLKHSDERTKDDEMLEVLGSVSDYQSKTLSTVDLAEYIMEKYEEHLCEIEFEILEKLKEKGISDFDDVIKEIFSRKIEL